MRFRFFFLIDFRKLLRLVILILILLVSTCSCTRPPGQLPLCRKGVSGCPCVKAVRSAGSVLDTRAAGSLFDSYEGQASVFDNVRRAWNGAPVRPGILRPHLHGRFVTSPVVACRTLWCSEVDW